MKYSVLMSVYIKENPLFLYAAVQSMLLQTENPDEFVLVCDGSLTPELDNCIEKICDENPIVKLVRLPENVGLALALNEGLKHCTNEIIARMDSDDIAMPDRCALQLKEMKDLDLLSGTVFEFDENPLKPTATRDVPIAYDEILTYAKRRNPFNHPAVMYRKSAVLAVHGYNNYPSFEDYELWLRMLKNGAKARNLSEPLVKMRTGAGLYKRRGGFSYIKYAIKFERQKKKLGFASMFDFLFCVCVRIVISLSPKNLRKNFYKNFLRK